MFKIKSFVLLLSIVTIFTSSSNFASTEQSKVNLTGKWKWQAIKNNQVILLGELTIKDDGKNISGEQKKIVPGKGGDLRAPAAINAHNLNGQWLGDYNFKFEVKDDNGSITESKAVASANGKRIEGKAIETIQANGPSFEINTESGQPQKTNLGKNFKLQYRWIAVKVK
jgi:hypothetical protein